MIKVAKFGGTSLANAEQFQKVYDIVKGDEARRYIVPSAPGKRFGDDTKVTDILYTCYKQAEKGLDFTDQLLNIQDRFTDIIEGLELDLSLDSEFEIIRENFEKMIGLEYAASRGEYLNGIILAHYLGFEFIDATTVIRFNSDGTLNHKGTNALLKKLVAPFENAIIPGYYGTDKHGVFKTFSRGGSDITGSLVALAVGADVYENWTDVSGFLIADPRIVKKPKCIEIITYRELRELSYMGASVLHDEALYPVKNSGIPIHIKNTNRPEEKGTLIVENTSRKPQYTITGIAGHVGFASITIQKALMNNEIGFCRRVLQVFEDNNISIEHMPSGIDTMTILVHKDHFEDNEQQILSSIHKAVNPDVIELESDLGLIAIVGRGMRSTRGTAGRIFSALAHAHINVKMIDQGYCELNIIIGVKNTDFKNAIRAIYEIFVDTVV
jgi:aspartate kinase